MNLVERINKDKRLKLLLFLILLVTVVLFMKIFYEYYVYSKNSELEETKVVLNDEKSVEIINYSDVLKLDNGKLDSNNNKISLSAEYSNSANYNVYVKVNNNVSNLVLKVIDNKGTSNIIDLSNKSGLYLVKSDCAINNSKDEWTFEVSGDTTNVDIDVILREDKVKISDYIKEMSSNNLYYLDSDNTYRYVGSNPNNYVCLGGNCSDANNLYRIIGVIDGKVKLIKNTASANMAIDEFTSNYNYTALVNYLNTPNENSYYTSISSYTNLIATTSWHVGGISVLSSNNIDVYNAEMDSSTVLREVGLMYISDYLYATDSEGGNWLNDGTNNWFITKYTPEVTENPDGSSETEVNEYYYVDSAGTISRANIATTNNVRPVFYLKNSVKIIGGSGTLQEPYLIGGNNA